MGEYNKGILGAFSGKVGPVVGANWRGKDIIRSLPKKSTKEPSEKQLLQRQRFSFATRFVTPLGPMLGRYFGHNMGDRSKKNMALSYHMKEAVTYVGGHFEMLYEKVQISKGDLLGLASPKSTAEAGAVILIEWNDNSGQATAKPTDVLIAVVYNPAKQTSEMFFNIAERSETAAKIYLPNYMVGDQVQCWASFISKDEKKYATSNYLGKILLI